MLRGIVISKISLKVNGRLHQIDVDPSTPLLFVLADELGLRGPKFGCGMAQFGACSVILRHQVVRSCVMPVRAVGQDGVTTLEGLGTPEKPHPIQQAFMDEGAAQCGFCLSGVILTAKAVLDEKPNASDDEMREALGGVMCRCFAHVRLLREHAQTALARRSGRGLERCRAAARGCTHRVASDVCVRVSNARFARYFVRSSRR
jgi:nicotinate dehydrogenase subunit A